MCMMTHYVACCGLCCSAAKMSGSLAEMVRQVAGPGIGGVVAAPLTGKYNISTQSGDCPA